MILLVGGAVVAGALASFVFNDSLQSATPTAESSAVVDPPEQLPRARHPSPPAADSAHAFEPKGQTVRPSDTGVRWMGETLIVDLVRVPVQQAIDALAAETQTTVHGGEFISGPAVTLKWQGRDAKAAWRQLLAPLAGVSIACISGRCEVWILDPAAPPEVEEPAATDETP